MMAKRLNIPLLLLAQLSRSHQAEKRPPELRDLRESGTIEQDADGVLLLHRPEDPQYDAVNNRSCLWAKVAKWREGATTPWAGDGAIRLWFAAPFTDFEEVPRF